ncbi:MAG: hypothetical protein ACREA0_25655, partial [bacterium]
MMTGLNPKCDAEPGAARHDPRDAPARPADPVPLCVDLDGTLIRSDLFVESLFALLRKNVAYLFLIPV